MSPTVQPRVLLPLPPSPPFEVFCLKIIGSAEGQLTVNQFHYINNKPLLSSTRTDLIDLAQAFSDIGGPLSLFAAAVTTEWGLTRLTVFSPTNPTLQTYEGPTSPLAGQAPAPALANQSCVTIQRRTLFRGRHGRGRVSIPSVARSWVTGTTLSNHAAHDNLAAILGAPISGAATTYKPGVLAKGPGPTVNYGWADIFECITNPILGTCRRRKPGVGK